MITRCTHRVFGAEQWTALQAKLHTWRANLKSILDTISKTSAASKA